MSRLGVRGRFLTEDVDGRPFGREADGDLAKLAFVVDGGCVAEDTTSFGAGGVWLLRWASFSTFFVLEASADGLCPYGEEVADDGGALPFFEETTPGAVPGATALLSKNTVRTVREVNRSCILTRRCLRGRSVRTRRRGGHDGALRGFFLLSFSKPIIKLPRFVSG